jgi:hypothetical protein
MPLRMKCSAGLRLHIHCVLTKTSLCLRFEINFCPFLCREEKTTLVIPKINVLSVLLAKIYFEPKPMPMDDGDSKLEVVSTTSLLNRVVSSTLLNQCQKQNVLWQLPSSIGIGFGSKYILANRTDKTFIFGITKVVFSSRH